MHRYTKADVREAFKVYQEVTGDVRASLHIWSPGDNHGTRYEIINASTDVCRSAGPVMLGAESAWRTIHTFLNGWRNGRDTYKKVIRETCEKVSH